MNARRAARRTDTSPSRPLDASERPCHVDHGRGVRASRVSDTDPFEEWHRHVRFIEPAITAARPHDNAVRCDRQRQAPGRHSLGGLLKGTSQVGVDVVPALARRDDDRSPVALAELVPQVAPAGRLGIHVADRSPDVPRESARDVRRPRHDGGRCGVVEAGTLTATLTATPWQKPGDGRRTVANADDGNPVRLKGSRVLGRT